MLPVCPGSLGGGPAWGRIKACPDLDLLLGRSYSDPFYMSLLQRHRIP